MTESIRLSPSCLHACHERTCPLPNLFVSTLQRLGVEADEFASSTGTMRGLDLG